MRIVYLITRSDTLGGAHIHVRDVCHAMIQRGHEASVMVGGRGPFTEALRAKGIPHRCLATLKRPISPLDDARAPLEIRGALREIQPDLVSIHSAKAGILGRLACASLGIPALFTAHGWSFTDGIPAPRRALYWSLEVATWRLARRIIVVSDYDRELALRSHIGTPERVVRVHNGMPNLPDLELAQPATRPLRMVTVARFDDQKDYPTLLRALDRLRDLPWEIDCIGDGPGLEPTRAEVIRMGLEDRVRCVGLRRDVPEFLSRAQLFLLVSNWEGFPRSILEAMRAGLPVVASDVGGSAESVVDGETGYVVPRGDDRALAGRIAELIASPDRARAMGDAGRQRYCDRFTFERMLDETVTFYDQVLAEARP